MTATSGPTAAPVDLRVVPAGEVPWGDMATVFGTRGIGSRCFCQRYKLAAGEAFGNFPAEERARRLDEQRGGLVAYDGEEPVGWCAVEPRSAYPGLVRVFTVPWKGRDEDRTDPSVWAVTCLFVRAGHRRQGISGELARAAVEHARARGARALEAYPMVTSAAIAEELHVGTVSTFADAGLTEVGRPTKRRAVMRIEL